MDTGVEQSRVMVPHVVVNNEHESKKSCRNKHCRSAEGCPCSCHQDIEGGPPGICRELYTNTTNAGARQACQCRSSIVRYSLWGNFDLRCRVLRALELLAQWHNNYLLLCNWNLEKKRKRMLRWLPSLWLFGLFEQNWIGSTNMCNINHPTPW